MNSHRASDSCDWRSHCTILEHDGTFRAMGVTYAVCANVFDKSVGLGDASPAETDFAYVCDRAGTPLAAIWSAHTKPKAMALALDAANHRRLRRPAAGGLPLRVQGP